MNNKNKTMLVWRHLTLWLSLNIGHNYSTAEVYSAVARLSDLLKQERQLLEHLQQVLNISASRGDNGRRYQTLSREYDSLKQEHEAAIKEPNVAEHPVGAFRLLRRLVGDWLEVTDVKPIENGLLIENLRGMREFISKWQKWPNARDLIGSALALVRLGQIYDIFPVPDWLRTEVIHAPSSNTALLLAELNFITKDDPRALRHCCSSTNDPDTRSSVHFCSKRSESCNSRNRPSAFSYARLSADDFLFVSEAAIGYKQYTQARRWFSLVEDHSCNNTLSTRTNRTVNHLKQLFHSQNPNQSEEEEHEKDAIQRQYKNLCQRSLQSHVSTLSKTLVCAWNYKWPYVRYNAEELHMTPGVVRYYDVISENEIEHIKTLAIDKLSPSELPAHHVTGRESQLFRVSQTAWLPDITPVIGRLSHRVGDVTGLSTRQSEVDTSSEPFQVVNYGLGGLYRPHEDSVRVSRRLGLEDIPALKNSGDRLATWMFYLSDVRLGGATVFPILNLTVTPIKGSAVFWYNLRPDGSPDVSTVHAACPVVVGNKWVANKWMREIGNKRVTATGA